MTHKMLKMLFIIFLMIISSSFLITTSAYNNNSSTTALVMKIVKDVEFKKSGSSSWEKAGSGTMLSNGDEIKTGTKSLALIKFLDNSLLRVRENSFVKIYADKKNDKSISKNTYIEKGKVSFDISKQKNDEFRFTTPTMVASIRGTSGMFSVMDDGTSLLLVDEGSIEVTSTVGEKKTETVKNGRFAFIDKNGEFKTGDLTDEQKKESRNSKSQNKKSLIIKTDKGDIVIDYLDNDK